MHWIPAQPHNALTWDAAEPESPAESPVFKAQLTFAISGTASQEEIDAFLLQERQRILSFAILALLPHKALRDACDSLAEVHKLYWGVQLPLALDMPEGLPEAVADPDAGHTDPESDVHGDKFIDPALKKYYASKGIEV